MTDVYDFSRNLCYSVECDNGDQINILNSIYEKVRVGLQEQWNEK